MTHANDGRELWPFFTGWEVCVVHGRANQGRSREPDHDCDLGRGDRHDWRGADSAGGERGRGWGFWSPDSRHFLFSTQVYPECSNKPTWAEEDACDKAKDDAVAASPVKAQVGMHCFIGIGTRTRG